MIFARKLTSLGASVVLAASVTALARPPRTADSSVGSTIFGARNMYFSEGATAIEQGRIDDGIQLTLEGLKLANTKQDTAAAHANLCGAYAAQRRWSTAMTHCTKSIELDPKNWRAFNNRAAVNVGIGEFDQAIADVQQGLAIAPDSATLKKSLRIIHEHKRANGKRKRSTGAA